MEFRVLWPDGSVRWLHDRGRSICDENSKALYMTGACVDVTARKQVDEALAEARARLDATLGASEIGTWVWDLERNRLSADANLARLFSLTPEDAAGSPPEHYMRMIHADDRAGVEAVVSESLQSATGAYDIDSNCPARRVVPPLAGRARESGARFDRKTGSLSGRGNRYHRAQRSRGGPA